MLFAALVNIAAAYISYHHPLWDFNADALASSETTVEMLNTFIAMPATVLVFPAATPRGPLRQARYILVWVALFASVETADTLLGGICYFNGWSLTRSIAFDGVMFSILRLHHLRPAAAWLATFVVGAFIIVAFGFLTAEMKGPADKSRGVSAALTVCHRPRLRRKAWRNNFPVPRGNLWLPLTWANATA
jgi:hypothetical protein